MEMRFMVIEELPAQPIDSHKTAHTPQIARRKAD
jgi:hypothetical protein